MSAMAAHPTLAITSGEPAGIGPELCAMLAERHARQHFAARLVVLGDAALLAGRARRIDISPHYARYDPLAFAPAGGAVEVWHQPLAAPAVPGHADPTNARSVLSMLEAACDACATGAMAALVTGPVQTSAIPSLEAHPLPRWLALGVRACVNTDNTLFSQVSAREEHARARSIPRMTDALLDRAIAVGHAAKFRR